MKRLLVMLILLTALTATYAQRSVDGLFNRYAGKDGFVTVTLSGDLLKLAFEFDDDDDLNRLKGKITELRVLVQEDDEMKVENFYDLVMKDINLNDYEEFMRVKKSDQDLRMLVRTSGGSVKEFLLIGGGEDNLVVQIKGDLTREDVEKISSDARKDNGRNMFSNNN
jgi:hypothetical protein